MCHYALWASWDFELYQMENLPLCGSNFMGDQICTGNLRHHQWLRRNQSPKNIILAHISVACPTEESVDAHFYLLTLCWSRYLKQFDLKIQWNGYRLPVNVKFRSNSSYGIQLVPPGYCGLINIRVTQTHILNWVECVKWCLLHLVNCQLCTDNSIHCVRITN